MVSGSGHGTVSLSLCLSHRGPAMKATALPCPRVLLFDNMPKGASQAGAVEFVPA